MPRRFRFVAVVALLGASLLGVAACGDDEAETDAGSLLRATFGPDHSVKSGDLALRLRFDSKGLKNISGPIDLKLDGPFESIGKGKLPKLDLSLSLTGSGANFSAGAVTTGDKGWLKLQGTTFVVDDPTFATFKEGYEQSAAKSGDSEGPSLKSLGIDPLRWLKDPEVLGTEEAGGTDSYHIRAGVDIGAFLKDVSALLGKAGAIGGQATSQLPSGLTEQQRRDIEASVQDASLEVWTGKDDKALRRIKLDIDIAVPQAVRPRAGGLSSGKLAFDLSINDLNKPQTIEVPKNARPLSELRELIQNGATGGNPVAPTSTTTEPANPPASAGDSKYLACLEKAGTSVAEIQKCAALVGQ